MGLKRAFKKLRKKLHLPPVTLGTAAKVGAAVATGGVGAGAAALGAAVLKSKLKTAAVGGVKQLVAHKAAKALHTRVAKLAPKIANAAAKAETMPGGAKLVKRAKAVVARGKKRVRKAAAKVKAPKAKGTRKPPKGGLDLKAIAAKWRAAGKPGKWIDFVKANR